MTLAWLLLPHASTVLTSAHVTGIGTCLVGTSFVVPGQRLSVSHTTVATLARRSMVRALLARSGHARCANAVMCATHDEGEAGAAVEAMEAEVEAEVEAEAEVKAEAEVEAEAEAEVEQGASSDSSFDELGLCSDLLRAAAAQGWHVPTPVQLRAIPAILAGADCWVEAPTGSGKTAAFALPLLQRLLQTPTGSSTPRGGAHVQATPDA